MDIVSKRLFSAIFVSKSHNILVFTRNPKMTYIIISVKYNLFVWILRRNIKLEKGYLLSPTSYVYVIYTRQNSLCV